MSEQAVDSFDHGLDGARVLITGGAGFIGSTLATRLIERNQITVFDNFHRDAISGTALSGHANLRLIRGDVLDAAAVVDAVADHTHVVHCAAIAGIDTVGRSPITTMRVNMIGSANVLEAASNVDGMSRVVCFSTSEIFGRRAFRSSEDDDAVLGAVGEPRWTYAVSKLAEEHLAMAYHSERGLPVTVVRPFNVYGPGQVGEGAIRIFMERALRDGAITVHGDGSQIRAWCYVDDMVEAVLRALVRPEAVGEAFNIGNVRSACTMTQLAQTVVRVVGSASTVGHVERSGPDVELRIPDVRKASRLIGFNASVDLEEGLRRTADWMLSSGWVHR